MLARLPHRNPSRVPPHGFVLVAALVLMILLAVLAVGLTTLAAIELRRSDHANHQATARSNARQALIQAIGQLQLHLGPDQRVSATADLIEAAAAEPHWTGVWRSTRDDGSSFYQRDDLTGGLRDRRASDDVPAADRVVAWLVSGMANDPVKGVRTEAVVMMRDKQRKPIVTAPLVPVMRADQSLSGRQAWWTGDLGVRANVATRDARHDLTPSRQQPDNGAWYRLMTSQAADVGLMDGEPDLEDGEIQRLASVETLALATAGREWSGDHAMDLTTASRGVLADVARGGLKRDLTAYFAGNGTVKARNGLPGLDDDDPLFGADDKSSRLRVVAPRFGLLRDWARPQAPFAGHNVAARMPEVDKAAGGLSAANALANEQPVKLAGNTRASLQPILVEATDFSHLSVFRLDTQGRYQLRFHHYPRVVLWNPYNVELDFERAMVMIQGNGRQEMWTEDVKYDANGNEIGRSQLQWLSFEGGRSTSFSSNPNILLTEGYNDPYIGGYYFAIPKTRFNPGECLVFSPAKQAEYDCLSPYRMGPYNLNANELSCTVAPDPARSYYISGTDIGGGIASQPLWFWFAPTPAWSVAGRLGVENQSDDTRAVLKHIGNAGSTVLFADFDAAPQLAVVSASLQYGAGREPRVAWNQAEKMPVELLDAQNPKPTVVPNVRTREGVRLRWFDEHQSNLINSGPLAGTPYAEEALLANWNPRAAFAVRSPWENIAGTLPLTGKGGGPWFFGAYTRDLYDQAVGWEEQTPVLSGGRCHGNPFGPPQEGVSRYILFDVPRTETGVVSLAQLQHVKLSDLVWHPSFVIGNSLADPRLATGPNNKGLARSAAVAPDGASAAMGGFHENLLGWSADTERSSNRNAWAVVARAILGNLPLTDNLIYDLSFESNHALWDAYFLSSGSAADKAKFIADPVAHPLPNGRMVPAPAWRGPLALARLENFHEAAACLWVDGAFNVNSTRVEAWRALLGSTRAVGAGENVPFPRVLDAPGPAWKDGDPADSEHVWAGRRELTPDEIRRLAEAIVAEVKLRGPFLSLADFVNRRLAQNETGRLGAIEAAIDKAGLNASLAAKWPINRDHPLPDYTHPDHIPDPTRIEQTAKPASKAWGATTWLTQADVLQVIGPALSARSDTFVIRAYGDAVDAFGHVTARAWCEATVQRTPEPLDPDTSGLNPRRAGTTGDFGRRFIITGFRWLSPAGI